MKKYISLLLSIIVCLTVFAGCTKSGSDSEYVITMDSHYDYVNDTAVRSYEKLCNAVINGEEEVRFNTAHMDEINQLFYTCFPLYPLVESIDILENNTGVGIKYKNDMDKHTELVSQFNDKISDIMKECRYSKVSTDEYIFNVYVYITSNFKIDSSIFTTFDTVVEGKGYNASINSLFEYLVLRGGGKASHIISSTGSNIMSMVNFAGKSYFFDPAKEIEINSGTALVYFAMDTSRAAGVFLYTDNTDVEKIEDDSFSKLALSESYTVKKSTVTVQCSDESEFVFNLN